MDFPDVITFEKQLAKFDAPAYATAMDVHTAIRVERHTLQLQWFASPQRLHGFFNQEVKAAAERDKVIGYVIPGYVCSRCDEVFLVPMMLDMDLLHTLRHACMGGR